MPDREKVEFIESYIKIGNGDYQWNDNHGELIRCKDCKHNKSYQSGEFFGCELGNGLHEPNWYCADGERRRSGMRLIDADALIDNIKTFRCIDCERRKGMKNGKLKFLYEIGDAPCRACDVADMIDTIDEAPTVGDREQ